MVVPFLWKLFGKRTGGHLGNAENYCIFAGKIYNE
jgi:hypothetical protein